MRRIIRALGSCVVGFASLAPLPAEATCTASEIVLNVQGGADELSATWHIQPRCDVVETGLMIGSQRDALARVSTSLYSAGPFYTQTIPVSESGVYWVKAYAVDEDGSTITSAPEFAAVIAVEQSGPHGSHGALPSYSGTDADFLVQAGNPHFASLRSLEGTGQIQRSHWRFGDSFRSDRIVGAMHRDEVANGQAGPLPFGLPPNTAQVTSGLTTLDNRYLPPSFPRRGFYVISCSAEQSENGDVFTNCTAPFFNAAGGLSIASVDEDNSTVAGVGFTHFTHTFRSTVRFFIPAAPPDQQVASAQLTAQTLTQSTPDAARQPRLNGKVPVSSTLSCGPFPAGPPSPAAVECRGLATWDFTDEIRTVASGGGGEFTITPDRMQPFSISQDIGGGATQFLNVGTTIVSLGTNYPWSHLGPQNNALTVMFEQACPKALAVSATPSIVMPPRPNFAGGTVQIRAEVTTCPGGASPTSVVVNFDVDPTSPQPGTPDANGHLHDSRPSTARGRLDATTCTIVVGANGTGSCTTRYSPSEVGSIERIVATAAGFPSAETKVRVENPGLVPLPADPARYVHVGSPENHSGTNDPCRMPPSSQHSPNHSARAAMNQAVVDIADAMLRDTGILARINDMSLPMGGLFDWRNGWQADHFAHRIGQDADIGFSGVLSSACVPYARALLEFHIRDITNRAPIRHSDHFHVFMP